MRHVIGPPTTSAAIHTVGADEKLNAADFDAI